MESMMKMADWHVSLGMDYNHTDATKQYCVTYSTDLAPCQNEILQESIKDKYSIMMTHKEVLQTCSNFIGWIGAKQVLDIGTFTGSTALAWACALPEDGRVITMDVSNEAYLKYGKKIIDKSGVAHKIDFRVQPAAKTLKELIDGGHGLSFDFAFIDADKESYLEYYDLCYKLIRPGGIIAVDNALWFGSVVANKGDAITNAIHAVNKKAKSDKDVYASLLPIGDGVMFVFKKNKTQLLLNT